MNAVDLPVSHVFANENARKIDRATVRFLMRSIEQLGIINPLRVRPARRSVNGEMADAYVVTAGGHRLEAAIKMNMATVPCIVVDDDDLHAELAMIDENLCRAELSPAERAAQTARRKALYLELHPETGHGRASPNKEENFSSFDKDTAEKTGVTDRLVRLHAERGEKIAPDVLEKVAGTDLDKGTYLDTLKKLAPEEQRQRVVKALASSGRAEADRRNASRIDADVKARAAKEAAEIIAEYVPAEAWDGLKANLYASGAKMVADALTNITGQSVMDRRNA